MTIGGQRVFTLVRRAVNGQEREVCVALDANSGDELWAADVDAAGYTDLSGYDETMDGPRSTPTLDGDRLYVFGSKLKLSCLETATGRRVWQRDFRAEFGSGLIPWENAASPLVVGELVFVNSNASNRSLMAISKSDGATVWSVENDGTTHASPVLARIGGVPQVIFLTRLGLVSVKSEDGTVLWRLRFTPSPTSTAASPAVVGEYVYASAAYGAGTWLARVERNGETFTAGQSSYQRGTTYQAHWSTPVSHDQFLYCFPSPTSLQGRLTCFDLAAGTNRWAQANVGSGPIGYGSAIKAGGVLIVLTEFGELVLVQPNPAAYTELGRFKALDRYCWNSPSLANGRLYARSTFALPELVALDVALSVAPAPLPLLNLGAELVEGSRLKLIVRVADGSRLAEADAARLELISSTDLDLPLVDWTVAPQAFTLIDGTIMAELPLGNEPARYLRVRQRAATE
jgi:outer membrane protein assembly factor BamB